MFNKEDMKDPRMGGLDHRAMKIGIYLKAGKFTPDALRCISYLIQKEEAAGELEIFISEEIDKC